MNPTQASPASRPGVGARTASSLLARFLPGVRTEHKNDASSPQKSQAIAIVADAELKDSLKLTGDFSSSNAQPGNDTIVVEPRAEDATEENITIAYNDAAANRRSMRQRKPNNSLKALENGDVPRKRSRNVASAKGTAFPRNPLPPVSARSEIRQEIANETAAHRNQFLLEKKDLWLPLLPEHNYVRKLMERHEQLSQEEVAKLPKVIPYEELEKQPRGVRATLKPYQLSGLSFMIYLHKNGLSGILGDEMGLGKTLQTLSLIQYLKENDPKAGTGRLQRPFLIVCPLSVLSSWMTEAAKWTPDLKAIRFHGPLRERSRLKQIVIGEIDMQGRMTAQAKARSKAKLQRKGKDVISLDSDSEDERDTGVDLVVTTYECYRAEQSWFKRAFVWRYVVLDEGHTVKNHESLVSKTLQGLNAEYRLILTGTPLQNNLTELWALLHFLFPEVFIDTTNALFDASFNLSKGDFSKDILEASRHLLELIMLRRLKTSPGVDLGLPPKTEILLFVPLTPMQRFWYERLITKADQGILTELFSGSKDREKQTLRELNEESSLQAQQIDNDARSDKLTAHDPSGYGANEVAKDSWTESRKILEQTMLREKNAVVTNENKTQWQKLLNLIMQLRKVCNHPYQIQNAEPNPYFLGRHVIEASGKFVVLEKLIGELVIKQSKKILIFSGFTKMLDLVEELLAMKGGDGRIFSFARIDGATCRARRNLSIRLFNDLSNDYRVMLISTRAGGLGINLASASDVVLLDQDWNPQITLQAEARAHRIGQKNPVTVYKLVSQGTVEEQMMGRIQKKLYLSAKVTESMEDIYTKFGASKTKSKENKNDEDDQMPEMNTSQLMTLIRRGASAISRPEINVHEMLNWDWATMVTKCKDQAADILVRKDIGQGTDTVDEEAERKWLSEVERVESKILSGKTLKSKAQTHKDIAAEYNASRADRRVGKNTTVEIDGYMVSKETVNNGKWEAVATISSRNRQFATPKREKKGKIEAQSHCQVCMDGGSLICCNICPRAYHFQCLDQDFKGKTKGWQFNCPQHQCVDCNQKTGDAGGMLYRCRWCERAQCEDCLDWDFFKPFGDELVEMRLLSYEGGKQAFWVQCKRCTNNFRVNRRDRRICEGLEREWEEEWQKKVATGTTAGTSSAGSMTRTGSNTVAADSEGKITRAESLTDATTIDTPGVSTPFIVVDDENDNNYEANIGTNGKERYDDVVFIGANKRRKISASGVV